MAKVHAAGNPLGIIEVCCYPSCEARTSAIVASPVCDRHAVEVYRAVTVAMRGTNEPTPIRTGHARPRHADRTQGSVYFLLQGHRVKIGFSTNVPQRIAALGGGELLATTPGTIRDEQALHRQFKALNDEGEWFWPGRELMAYISGLAA